MVDDCVARELARRLSHSQREALIDHIDKAVPVRVSDMPYRITVNSLIRNSLVKTITFMDWPRATLLTEKGRHVVCCVLADYAEAIATIDPNYHTILGSHHEYMRHLRARRESTGRSHKKGASLLRQSAPGHSDTADREPPAGHSDSEYPPDSGCERSGVHSLQAQSDSGH